MPYTWCEFCTEQRAPTVPTIVHVIKILKLNTRWLTFYLCVIMHNNTITTIQFHASHLKPYLPLHVIYL